MASRGAIAGIQAEALKRVEAATAEIVAQLGITVPPAAPHAKQAELRDAWELERQADLLEQIAGAVATMKDGEPNADTSEGSQESEDDADGDAPESDGDDAPVVDPAADAPGDAPVDEYEHMTVAKLRSAALERQVDISGVSRKADLVDALRAADAAGA